MSLAPKPCAHCGNTNLCFLPNMMQQLRVGTTVFGAAAAKKIGGVFWSYTLVVCTNCGYTQTFTTNAQDLMQHVPASSVQTVAPR